MSVNKTLIICPDHRSADALACYYRHTPSIVVKGPSVMGHRADTVVVLPIADDASDREHEMWETATREHFACRVAPNGKLVAL